MPSPSGLQKQWLGTEQAANGTACLIARGEEFPTSAEASTVVSLFLTQSRDVSGASFPPRLKLCSGLNSKHPPAMQVSDQADGPEWGGY